MAEDDFEKRFRARLDAKGPTATIEPPSGAGGSFEDRFRKRLGLADGNGGNEPNAPGSPPTPDPVRAAKDAAWLGKQQAAQALGGIGLPEWLYNALYPTGQYLDTVQRGYQGKEVPEDAGLLDPTRVGRMVGTGQDITLGTLAEIGAPELGPLSFGAGMGGSQYLRESSGDEVSNPGERALATGGTAAAFGLGGKALGFAGKLLPEAITKPVQGLVANPVGKFLTGTRPGQTLLGGAIPATLTAAQGGSGADIAEQGLAGAAGSRLGRALGPAVDPLLGLRGIAGEAAKAGTSQETMARASPGGSSPFGAIDPMVQAALPWGPGGRVARAAYRGIKGGYEKGADERALYDKIWETMAPGEEWTPTPKSGTPLERGPATGPNQPNQPLPQGAQFPGPLGPPQPPTGPPMGPLPPPGPIQGTQVAPKMGGQIPRFPRFGGGAGGGAPEAPPMGPQQGLPQPSEEEIADLLGQTRGPLAGTSRFGTVNPAEGVRPSEPLESTFPGGIQRFQKPPPAAPAIEAERAAVKGALRKAAREGLEGQGPPEELPPAPPPRSPQRPIGPRPSAAPVTGKAPPATITTEVPNVAKPAPPPAAPPAAPATPKATFYEGKGGEVVRITGEKVETLGEGGKVLTSEEVKDRVKGVGKILGTMGAKRVSDPERIAELLKRGSTPKAAAPAQQTVLRSATKPVEPESTPKTTESAPKPAEKKPETTRTLTETHEARKAKLSDPYPEDPSKTNQEKFDEVMKNAGDSQETITVRYHHQGHGQPEKLGKYFEEKFIVRKDARDPGSGRVFADKAEMLDAGPEGSANEFRRSLSPYSVDRVTGEDGKVRYLGPEVEGSQRAQERLKTATEPEKPPAAVEKEAAMKAAMKAETDPEKKADILEAWEKYRREHGLGGIKAPPRK